METLLITTKDKQELNFVTEFLKRMRIKVEKISIEDKEDIGLTKLMKEVDRTQTVSYDEVLSKLQKK